MDLFSEAGIVRKQEGFLGSLSFWMESFGV